MAKPTHPRIAKLEHKLKQAKRRVVELEQEYEQACDLRRQVACVKDVVDRWIASWQLGIDLLEVPDRGPVGN
jgi:hypothetical protein